MKKSYWNSNGNYQEDYDRLYDDLVPDVGDCDVIAGELIRAASKLGHDFYNNRMCNNTTGSIHLLLNYNCICADTYLTIKPMCEEGRSYEGDYDDEEQREIELLVDQTVLKVLDTPQWFEMPTLYTIFDLEEKKGTIDAVYRR